MPAPYIFQTTTCLKSEFMIKFAEIMTAGGWANVSSNPATDFQVWKSTSEEGNKALVFQFRDTSNTATNSIISTNYSVASIRLVAGYTPNATQGVAGTFARAAEAWRGFNITSDAGASVPPNSTLTIRYHINKNHVMLGIEPPTATGILPSFIYVGLPDVQYCTESGSKGVIFAQTQNVGASQNQIYVTDAPDEGVSQTASVVRLIAFTYPSKNPNVAGKYIMSDIYVQEATEGVRFKLDGLYIMPPTGLIHGDTITIGTAQFFVFVPPISVNSSFYNASNAAFALQTSI